MFPLGRLNLIRDPTRIDHLIEQASPLILTSLIVFVIIHGVMLIQLSNGGSDLVSADDHDASIVYTVQVGGGTPRRVTAVGPSYLHGWSPDGRFLVYTGERHGEFDVYRISVDGGDERRLT